MLLKLENQINFHFMFFLNIIITMYTFFYVYLYNYSKDLYFLLETVETVSDSRYVLAVLDSE